MFHVSAPIRGLFNLTRYRGIIEWNVLLRRVSVPIRGLFNLTRDCLEKASELDHEQSFCPHQGII